MVRLETKNGRFKVMQFADIQEIVDFSPDTENLMRAVLQKENPDLAVLTGDQIKSYGVSMLGGDSRAKAEKIISKITSIFESAGTPFAVLFGNHDAFGEATREYQYEIYARSPMFVTGGEYLGGVGTFSIPVYAPNGGQAFNIYGFESCEWVEELNRFVNVPERQLELYRKERDAIREREGRYVPSLAFQHIPVHEIHEILKRVPEGTPGAVRGKRPFDGRYFVLGDTVRPGAFLGENAGISDVNTGEFQALREKRDVLGLFFGHDHNNSFVGSYQGMDLGYCQSCGFNCYGPGFRRGVRVYVLDEARNGEYDTYTVTFAGLFGERAERPLVKVFYDHAASSKAEAVEMGKNVLKKAAIGVAGAFAVKGLIDTMKNGRRD
ncbi:MAG: metallophosphoesterase family protein [Clostridia bacterium]|nr:metallophosphoesterase family protein [Clostridia bacterium]